MKKEDSYKRLCEITGIPWLLEDVEEALKLTIEKWSLIREHPDLAKTFTSRTCGLCNHFFYSSPDDSGFLCHDSDQKPCPLAVRFKDCMTGPNAINAVAHAAHDGTPGRPNPELVRKIEGWISRMTWEIETWRERRKG